MRVGGLLCSIIKLAHAYPSPVGVPGCTRDAELSSHCACTQGSTWFYVSTKIERSFWRVTSLGRRIDRFQGILNLAGAKRATSALTTLIEEWQTPKKQGKSRFICFPRESPCISPRTLSMYKRGCYGGIVQKTLPVQQSYVFGDFHDIRVSIHLALVAGGIRFYGTGNDGACAYSSPSTYICFLPRGKGHHSPIKGINP